MMKKDRNSFFSQFGSYGYNNTQPPMMTPQEQFSFPSQQMSSNMSYQMTPSTPMTPMYAQDNDLDARLSKIERELNRIDARLSKLESASISSINNNNTNTDYNFANSMYMV